MGAAGKLGVIIEKKRTRLINTSQVCKNDNKTVIKQPERCFDCEKQSRQNKSRKLNVWVVVVIFEP